MKKQYKEYSSIEATREVVGCLLLNPSLLKNYKILYTDFTKQFYQYVFMAIEHLYKEGATEISPLLIEEYLRNHKDKHANFQREQGVEVLKALMQKVTPANFDYHFQLIKKFSLLRELKKSGVDVSYYFDPDEVDVEVCSKKRELLENTPIEDIVAHFKSIFTAVSSQFIDDKNIDKKKAGVGFMEQKELWKKQTAWGVGYSSAFLTTALHGIRQRRYVVKSAGTGVGKTRTTIADICYAFAPKYYNKKLKKWCANPNKASQGCLYIGTEMELVEEIDPIMIAYMADVPQEHIEFNKYVDDEEERVDMAIKILAEEGRIYETYCPDYNYEKLESIIEEHVHKYEIGYVFFDYIHTTADLVAEYAEKASRSMAIREDQVLAELSTKLKNLCRTYNVSFDSCTQVSGDFKNTENRDQTIVRGAKSIIDKADVGIIAMPPSEKELKLVNYILTNNKLRGDNRITMPTPNLVLSIYKNRGGKDNKIKIWLYIDYDTMRTHDLFVTDYSYKFLKDFPRTYINAGIATIEGETIPIDVDEAEVEAYKKRIGLEDFKIVLEEDTQERVLEGVKYDDVEFESLW